MLTVAQLRKELETLSADDDREIRVAAPLNCGCCEGHRIMRIDGVTHHPSIVASTGWGPGGIVMLISAGYNKE